MVIFVTVATVDTAYKRKKKKRGGGQRKYKLILFQILKLESVIY